MKPGSAIQRCAPAKAFAVQRVPAGAKFDFDIHVRVFQGDDEEKVVGFIKRGLELLTSEYLGGSGTRGYGWVDVEYTVRDVVPQ